MRLSLKDTRPTWDFVKIKATIKTHHLIQSPILSESPGIQISNQIRFQIISLISGRFKDQVRFKSRVA